MVFHHVTLHFYHSVYYMGPFLHTDHSRRFTMLIMIDPFKAPLQRDHCGISTGFNIYI